jgi:hypothetical protein
MRRTPDRKNVLLLPDKVVATLVTLHAGIEAAANLTILTGAVVLFLIKLEERLNGAARSMRCTTFVPSSMSSTCTS